MASLVSGWRHAGFDVQQSVVPVALAQDNQARATFSGIFSYNTGASELGMLAYLTSQTPRPDNQWSGQNRGGWSNPEYDRLGDALSTSLDRAERNRFLVEMAKVSSELLPAISLFFPVQPWVFDAALRGPTLVASESDVTWNIHEWELQ
jgi:ABC-type transport system substrate-binding protein